MVSTNAALYRFICSRTRAYQNWPAVELVSSGEGLSLSRLLRRLASLLRMTFCGYAHVFLKYFGVLFVKLVSATAAWDYREMATAYDGCCVDAGAVHQILSLLSCTVFVNGQTKLLATIEGERVLLAFTFAPA